MKFVENMNLQELEAERERQQRIVDKNKKIMGISNETMHRDDPGESFPCGVGFRSDRKRYEQSMDRSINCAVKYVEARKNLDYAERAIAYIDKRIAHLKEAH